MIFAPSSFLPSSAHDLLFCLLLLHSCHLWAILQNHAAAATHPHHLPGDVSVWSWPTCSATAESHGFPAATWTFLPSCVTHNVSNSAVILWVFQRQITPTLDICCAFLSLCFYSVPPCLNLISPDSVGTFPRFQSPSQTLPSSSSFSQCPSQMMFLSHCTDRVLLATLCSIHFILHCILVVWCLFSPMF